MGGFEVAGGVPPSLDRFAEARIDVHRILAGGSRPAPATAAV
jgi:hypothetical protein